MKGKDGAFVVLFKNSERREVFLVLRSDFPIWGLTGGGVEKSESPTHAAIREAGEETGFKVKIVRKLGVYNVCGGNGKKIRDTYLFEGRKISGKFRPEFPGCKGQWFNIDRLPRDLTSRTIQKISDAIPCKGKPFVKQASLESFNQNISLLLRYPLAATKYIWQKRVKPIIKA